MKNVNRRPYSIYCGKTNWYIINNLWKNKIDSTILSSNMSIYLSYVYITILKWPYWHLTNRPKAMPFCGKLDLYKIYIQQHFEDDEIMYLSATPYQKIMKIWLLLHSFIELAIYINIYIYIYEYICIYVYMYIYVYIYTYSYSKIFK